MSSYNLLPPPLPPKRPAPPPDASVDDHKKVRLNEGIEKKEATPLRSINPTKTVIPGTSFLEPTTSASKTAPTVVDPPFKDVAYTKHNNKARAKERVQATTTPSEYNSQSKLVQSSLSASTKPSSQSTKPSPAPRASLSPFYDDPDFHVIPDFNKDTIPYLQPAGLSRYLFNFLATSSGSESFKHRIKSNLSFLTAVHASATAREADTRRLIEQLENSAAPSSVNAAADAPATAQTVPMNKDLALALKHLPLDVFWTYTLKQEVDLSKLMLKRINLAHSCQELLRKDYDFHTSPPVGVPRTTRPRPLTGQEQDVLEDRWAKFVEEGQKMRASLVEVCERVRSQAVVKIEEGQEMVGDGGDAGSETERDGWECVRGVLERHRNELWDVLEPIFIHPGARMTAKQ